MNPYPVLTKLERSHVLSVRYAGSESFILAEGHQRLWTVRLTPAEVLALADELKAFVAAQATPPE